MVGTAVTQTRTRKGFDSELEKAPGTYNKPGKNIVTRAKQAHSAQVQEEQQDQPCHKFVPKAVHMDNPSLEKQAVHPHGEPVLHKGSKKKSSFHEIHDVWLHQGNLGLTKTCRKPML